MGGSNRRDRFSENSNYQQYRFVQPRDANKTAVVNVFDYGAKGNGQDDDTNAFQSAINAMGKDGGIVFAPDGNFRFNGHLSIPRGVTLEGTYRCVPAHASGQNPSDHLNFGTILMPYEGRNNENGVPFISMAEDSTIRGFVIYYPAQLPNQAPVPYPWSIDMKGNNPAALDIECLNCWNALRAVSAHRHYIARIQGQPINIGLYIDETYDIGRIEDVHFNPWYSSNKAFVQWQMLHGRAFVIARSDWEYVFNTFAFGYAIGYHFWQSPTGACNGNFLGIGADMTANASILVEQSDPWGLLITNGEFTSFIDPNWGPQVTSPAQVKVTATNTGSVRFVNSAFWGPSDNVAVVAGTGNVAFSDCIFSAWDASNQNNYCIVANSGALQVNGCDFQKDGNQISISANVKRAVVIGNLFEGKQRIVNNAQRSEVGFNVASSD